MRIDAQAARAAMASAERLFSPAEVEEALDRMASEITRRLERADPLVLVAMNGGLVPAGLLLPRLEFPLRLDYLHATRYRERTFGTELQWKRPPEERLEGRTLLIIDDILDEGHTLQAILEHCRQAGAREVLSAVLVHKIHPRSNGLEADFTGVKAPDRYLFGYGMDYKGYWRNAPGIYAIDEALLQ